MEKQLLSNAVLKPAYDKITWLYVFRDFSESPTDLAAERVSIRFGLTSWPQHLLVNPETLEVIGDTGRSATSFLKSVDLAGNRVQPSKSLKAADDAKKADSRAIQLEKTPTVELAREYLGDSDIVVRYRALHVLAEKDPQTVAEMSGQLLLVPNGPFRYEVCKVLTASGNGEAVDALEKLTKQPVNSRNPNVLRINAIQALGACGDEGSVAVIAPFASSGQYLNGLTGISVSALAAIAERKPELKTTIVNVLKRCYPKPPLAGQAAVHQRPCVSLAKKVHAALEKLTGRKVTFPNNYNSTSRAGLINSW